jgi:hypothetical protein
LAFGDALAFASGFAFGLSEAFALGAFALSESFALGAFPLSEPFALSALAAVCALPFADVFGFAGALRFADVFGFAGAFPLVEALVPPASCASGAPTLSRDGDAFCPFSTVDCSLADA